MAAKSGQHTMWSGAGLVIANMIGVGVLLSTGFMAQDMSSGPIMLAWVIGAVIAGLGVVSYAGLVSVIGESGGEYRFLSDLFHPFLGYLAGWGSLILGFSAAIAVDAYAIGSFSNTLVDGPDPRMLGALVIALFVVMHALNASLSHRSQNLLVVVKLAFFIIFVALGLALGSHGLPEWTPPNAEEGFPWGKIIENQYWIAFAFSGWNAAVYTAKEFKRPQRDVALAMAIGLTCVSVLYLLVNWIFVVNLTPEQAAGVFTYEESRVTLAHLIASDVFGNLGGQIVSVFIIWAFLSAISAMMMVGPRVYVAMAKDGVLPQIFAGKDGKPPLTSTLLQAGVAMVLLFSHDLREIVLSASIFLMVFTTLSALSLFRVRRCRPDVKPPSNARLICALAYAGAVGTILAVNLQHSVQLWLTLGVVILIALAGFLFARRQQRVGKRTADASEG